MKTGWFIFVILFTTICTQSTPTFAYPTLSASTNQLRPFTKPLSNRVQNPRLSLVQWDQYDERDVQGRNTYAFGYDVQNPETDDTHFRHEERLANGTVVGSYGYVTPDGNAHIVKYIADHLGYRAKVETVKRLADVKPIPVNVEQDLADELASAELLLHDESDNYEKRYNNVKTRLVNNQREQVYGVRDNLARAFYV